jgi:hypothetical protein
MRGSDPKAVLHEYLRSVRATLLWKLDGLDEYDVRRPMTPTGTNLLGLVKHLAGVEAGYFGETFDRPLDPPVPWLEGIEDIDDVEPNVDMWATAEESRAQIVDLYRRASAHADKTIDELPLDAVGRVPWWPDDRSEMTLQTALVRVLAETNRHAGHADIVRELIDSAAGHRQEQSNLPPVDQEWWESYRNRLERAAREAARLSPQD